MTLDILLMVQKSGEHQLRLVVSPLYPVYPIIYKVLYIAGGCLGFLPSTVLLLCQFYFRDSFTKSVSSPPKYLQFQQGFNAFLHFLNLQKPQLPRRETTPRESHRNQKSMLDTGNFWQLQAQQIHEEFTKR